MRTLAPHFPPTLLFPLLGLPSQLVFGAGVACVLVGIYLRWRLSDYLMHAEDMVKDRRLTEDQARRRVRFLAVIAAVAMIAGFVSCAAVLLS